MPVDTEVRSEWNPRDTEPRLCVRSDDPDGGAQATVR